MRTCVCVCVCVGLQSGRRVNSANGHSGGKERGDSLYSILAVVARSQESRVEKGLVDTRLLNVCQLNVLGSVFNQLTYCASVGDCAALFAPSKACLFLFSLLVDTFAFVTYIRAMPTPPLYISRVFLIIIIFLPFS